MARSSRQGPKGRWTPHALGILERARRGGLPRVETARSDYERDVLRLLELGFLEPGYGQPRGATPRDHRKTAMIDVYRLTDSGETAIRHGTVDPERIVDAAYQSTHRWKRQAVRQRIKQMQRSQSHTRTLIAKTIDTVGLSCPHSTDWLDEEEFALTTIGKVWHNIEKHVGENMTGPVHIALGEVGDLGTIGFSQVEGLMSPTKVFKRFLHDIPAPNPIDDTSVVFSLSRFDGGALLVRLRARVRMTKEERAELTKWEYPRETIKLRGLFLTSSEVMATYLMMELR